MEQKAVITKKLEILFEQKGLTAYSLAKLINYNDSSMSQMLYGRKKIPDNVINSIASILEVSPEQIKGWILANKYSKKVLQRALQLKQKYTGQDKLIFTAKIHELMEQHNLTINPFAKTIGYNQGWLSQVVLGKEPVSKKLMEKLCAFSGLSEEEISSWIVTDKYSVETLRVAVEC